MLYRHQQDGAAWLAARLFGRGYLGDVPGLGKTRTIIEGLRLAGAKRPLVICPAIARTHWAREFEAMGWAGETLIHSYEEITRGGFQKMASIIHDWKADSLAIDEAHRTKNAGAQRTQLILGPDGYARRLPTVYLASGTPVPKNPASYWTVLSSLFPEVAIQYGLKTYQDFLDRFCVTRGSYIRGAWREKVLPTIKDPELFREILDATMLRRTLDDVGLDVPALDWQTVRLDGADTLQKLVDPSVVDVFSEGRELTKLVGDHLDSLADIENDPHVARMRRRLGELKVDPVVEMLKSQLEDSDEKVVVFAHHREVLARLGQGLSKFGPVMVHGEHGQKVRDRHIDRFQTDPTCRVFIGQNIACMEAITLTAARRAILVEPDWTADVNHQLGKRIARIGQRAERCVAQMVALAGTLDEAIVGQNLQEVRMAETIGLGEK